MEIKNGYQVEKAMKKWFKGESHSYECVDFQTKTSLYEVKSCNFLIECGNGNYKRRFVNQQHKKIRTTQLGRFHIKNDNHISLKSTGNIEDKIPKYIFVIRIGNQNIWRVKSWDFVDEFIQQDKETTPIRLRDIFRSELL